MGPKTIVYAVIGLVVVGFLYLGFASSSSSSQTVDLGIVADRTDKAFSTYGKALAAEAKTDTKAGDSEAQLFTKYYAKELNADPKFFDKPFGVAYLKDGAFQGFADTNRDGQLQQGEEKLFKTEVDEQGKRIIVSDMKDDSLYFRPSWSGIFAGLLIGSMLNRQRSSGLNRSSFTNRGAKPRSSYVPPASSRYNPRRSSSRSAARSGGSRFGK